MYIIYSRKCLKKTTFDLGCTKVKEQQVLSLVQHCRAWYSTALYSIALFIVQHSIV